MTDTSRDVLADGNKRKRAAADVGNARPPLDFIIPTPSREDNLERIAELGTSMIGGLLEDLKVAAELWRAIDSSLELTDAAVVKASDRLRAVLIRHKLL